MPSGVESQFHLRKGDPFYKPFVTISNIWFYLNKSKKKKERIKVKEESKKKEHVKGTS